MKVLQNGLRPTLTNFEIWVQIQHVGPAPCSQVLDGQIKLLLSFWVPAQMFGLGKIFSLLLKWKLVGTAQQHFGAYSVGHKAMEVNI